MTDAQAALAQVREALAAGPTPGEWVCYDDSSDGKTNRIEIAAIGKTVARIYRSVQEQDLPNARLIAACSPANMRTILAHVEAQAAENERMTEENRRLRADLLAGRNVVNAGLTIQTLTLERDDLRRQLDEAEQDARRYRWLRKFARQNTAYDVYKDGAHWSVGLHSDDHRQTFDQAIDAAMGASNE